MTDEHTDPDLVELTRESMEATDLPRLEFFYGHAGAASALKGE